MFIERLRSLLFLVWELFQLPAGIVQGNNLDLGGVVRSDKALTEVGSSIAHVS